MREVGLPLRYKWGGFRIYSMCVAGNEPLTRYVKLRVAHAPEMPGTLSWPRQVSVPDMHHGTHVWRTCCDALIIFFSNLGYIYTYVDAISWDWDWKKFHYKCTSVGYSVIKPYEHILPYAMSSPVTDLTARPQLYCTEAAMQPAKCRWLRVALRIWLLPLVMCNSELKS